ncbi:MAG TPA: glycosyltransferase family 4 protein [Hyphomicrobium sp.]|nr:glycosyltransferase family 4 protein [Hyphomicrobium sp.]
MRWPWQKPPAPPPPKGPTIDPVGDWNWVRAEPFGPDAGSAGPGTINWFVPPLGKGSGGHLTIFRFVSKLEAAGFECRVIICHDGNQVPEEHIKTNIDNWFFPLKARVFYHPQQEVPSAAISVATGWQTAYPVKAFRGTRRRCYFVQDYEPWFYSPGSVSLFAEETYRFGFLGITAGDWIAEKLHRDFGMQTHPFGFSYDPEIYRPAPKLDDVPRIMFYARPPTTRRAFELGLLVLATLAQRRPEIEICLAGWNLGNYIIPFKARSAGLLSFSELAALYTQCDAALVLSLTNVSLLPLELMACGCLVISNRGRNVEWLLDDEVALLADTRIDALVGAIEKAIDDVTFRKRLVSNGLRKAQATSWNREAEKLAALFRELDS